MSFDDRQAPLFGLRGVDQHALHVHSCVMPPAPVPSMGPAGGVPRVPHGSRAIRAALMACLGSRQGRKAARQPRAGPLDAQAARKNPKGIALGCAGQAGRSLGLQFQRQRGSEQQETGLNWPQGPGPLGGADRPRRRDTGPTARKSGRQAKAGKRGCHGKALDRRHVQQALGAGRLPDFIGRQAPENLGF